MAQHAILRFEKHKGHPAGPLEAHHERKKEQYASNPDIDTSRSKYNFHIVKPDGRYYHFIQSRIEQARCRTRKDSTRFVDTLITASPEFFKGKSPKEIAAYFQRAADFLIDRVGRENIVSAMVHMDEKTPHLHLVFVPLTKDNRLCAKEIIGNRANLTKWQDDFHACMVEQYPDLERGESASKTGRKQMLRNPVYVQADLDVYEFFKSQGTVIVNDVADFTGMNGCYLYQGRDVKASKKNDLKDQMLVLAPHEGIVPSDTWLTCRKKLMNNMKIQSARKATHTWLAGKIKCGNCGYALMSIYNPSGKQYLRCTKRLDNKSCPGCGKIITSELEAVVYQQMVKKLASYKTLTGKKKAAKANPKITALQVELAHVDSEIEKLVDSLTGANNVLFSYVNVKIAELDGRKQELLARIAELTVEAISPEQVSQISGYLDTWENVSFDDKRRVVDLMITTIAATSDSLNITWKI